MKHSNWLGVTAAVVLIISCFFPWTFYPDLQKYFTGFFSEQNMYGKPGKVLLTLSAIAIFLFLFPKIWAKRANWIICALIVAYSVKTYILYTSCYLGVCPIKQIAIYLMLSASVIMLLTSVFSDFKIDSGK